MDKVKGIVRYMHAVNPSAARGSDKMRYSCSILIPKDDPQVPRIIAALAACVSNGFPAGMPASADTCWEDLAITNPGNAALANYYQLKSATGVEYGQPSIFDAQLQPCMDPGLDGKLTGQWVWIGGQFATYTAGKSGVKYYFNGLMVTGEDAQGIDKGSLSSKPDMRNVFAGAAPVPAAPVPAAPVPAAPVPAARQMTPAAQGATYESMIAAGWTDEMLITNGMMLPPGGVTPAFMH